MFHTLLYVTMKEATMPKWNSIKLLVAYFNVMVNNDTLLEDEKSKINAKQHKILGW